LRSSVQAEIGGENYHRENFLMNGFVWDAHKISASVEKLAVKVPLAAAA
jgi:hypothetical protein